MKGLDKLAKAAEDFSNALRNLNVDGNAGDGEYADHDVDVFADDDDDNDNVVAIAQAANRRRDGIDDATEITMKSGDLRKVIDSYRKFTRYAREGRIPTSDERCKWHESVRAVKHLIRQPNR
jgi:hypothetical protein